MRGGAYWETFRLVENAVLEGIKITLLRWCPPSLMCSAMATCHRALTRASAMLFELSVSETFFFFNLSQVHCYSNTKLTSTAPGWLW